jgi:putative membrane protein
MKLMLWVFLKGMLMGAADVVPGVSGGTIAFITGIYERLLQAIKAVPSQVFLLAKEGVFFERWRQVDGTFLITLLAGIVSSVFLFANLIAYLLQAFPILVWSGFFGLILASAFVLKRATTQWQARELMVFVVGFLSAWYLSALQTVALPHSLFGIFISGLVAISAMILPGISGSFILLMLGTYSLVLDSIKNFELNFLLVFASGCAVGLLSMAHVLSWALRRHHNVTLALLTGVMLGALNKVWPWKQTVSFRENSKGEIVPLEQINLLPTQFQELVGADPQFIAALGVFGLSFILVLGVSRVNSK